MKYNKALREARNFALSLISENYVFVLEYECTQDKFAYIKMRHRTNQNLIMITAHTKGWTAIKNKKIIKNVIL